ncbi:uncharacterized protein LOC135169925 [Diachasmimorpha longicaudata]|uniref:uncharacterized protein LOC135169925 n=1 Tax=Diachasmimorpha longicaudata TaxID=58733 RepID=UPI0030B8D520
MTSPPIKYTTNRAIDHFNVAATLMKIIGYVDSIEDLRELPKSPSKWIYKCILNNNDGRRVRILCSGDDALKYKDEIKMYQGTLREKKYQRINNINAQFSFLDNKNHWRDY